ncbi:hypothetical protein C5167_017540 [Papaver somniferum]|uniref:HORMA domain-containing protein n=1 Tax=Papaver somniferum TaxID=3469 RepID=A0A4Y7INR0_PAPSO|nr:hypothetical protein C5167_017540 [Papaver somniferum]
MEWNQGSLMVMVSIRLLIQTQQKWVELQGTIGGVNEELKTIWWVKIPKLMPIDAESRRIIDGMESSVYDALQKKYLRTLLFCISEAIEGPIIEEYAWMLNLTFLSFARFISFGYSSSNSEDVMMNISHTGNKKQGATFRSYGNADITPNKMRYNRVLPTFFIGCSEEEANHPWLKTPLKMAIGNVNSKHIVLPLKVKSILVPYQDENNDIEDDEAISLGVDSVPTTEPPNPDSECINFNLVVVMEESQMNDEFWVLNSAAGAETSQRTEFLQKKGSDGISEEDWYVVMLQNVLRMVVLNSWRMNLSGSLYVLKAAAELKLELNCSSWCLTDAGGDLLNSNPY